MADNVTLNAGSGGDVVATEDIGGVEYQKVKLVDGTATSTTTIPLSGDLTNGLDVDVTRVQGTVTVGSHDVTNAGTFAVQVDGAALTALQLIDDYVFADDAAFTLTSSKVAMMGAIRDDALATLTAVEGDAVPLRVDSAGALHVNINSYTDSQVDDAAFATTTDSVAVIGAVATPTDTSVDANDGGAVAMSLDRRLHVDADLAIDGTSITGGAGAVAAGTPRVTLASDDPAVAALQIIDNAVFADDAAFTLTSSSVMVGGAIRDDALTTLTAVEGDAVPLRVNSTGALHVTGGGGGTQYNVDDAGPTVVTMAGAVRDDSLTTLTEIDGDATLLRVNSQGALHVTGGGGGTEYSEDVATPATIVGTATMMERDDALATLTPIEGDWAAQRCTAEGALWTQDFNSDAMAADLATLAGAVSTEMQVDVVGSLPAGTNAIGKLAANSGVDIGDVDVLSIAAGSNLIGDVGLSGARTSGGTTIFRSLDLDETEEEIKATAGQIYWIHAMNLTAATLYLKIYNATAATVIVGTTTPVLTFPIATQGDTNGAGFTFSVPNGIAFGTAITAAVTTGVADNDTTGPAANGCVVNIGYA